MDAPAMTQAPPADVPLTRKVMKASAWSFGLRLTERVLQLCRTVVLARLLSPQDFGLFGIALLVLASLESFSVTGFQQALVQKKDDIRPYLDTAWTFAVLRGFALAVIVFLSGPLVGRFFHEPRAVVLFQAAALCVLLRGFTNIGTVYFQKDLTFHKQFIFWLSGTVADLAVSTACAIIFRNAWALLLGFLTGITVRVIVSFVVEPYRPRFRLDMQKAREMSVFGRWVFVGGILSFLLNHGDDLTVGRLLDAVQLGLYRMAYLLASLPTSEIAQTTSDIIFAALSKLQGKLDALRDAYLDTVLTVAAITFPMTAGLIFVTQDLTTTLLGKKWLPMMPALQVLALWGFTRAIAATTGALFQSVGRPAIGAKLQFARLAVFAALVYPLTLKAGIFGTGLAVAISGFALEPLAIFLTLRLVACSWIQFLKLVVSPGLATAFMWMILEFTQPLLKTDVPALHLAILVPAGAIAYFLGLMGFDRMFGSAVRRLVERRLRWLFQKRIPAVQFLEGEAV